MAINKVDDKSSLTTDDVYNGFSDCISSAEKDVKEFLTAHTGSSGLELGAESAFELQALMADVAMASQTGSSTLKSIKDSALAAARNI